MAGLPWGNVPHSPNIAQLEDRKYVVQFQQSFSRGKPDTWSALCTYTPGPYIWNQWGFPSQEAAIAAAETHYQESLKAVQA